MTAFVIVHGAWGGGWEWAPVARVLRREGHDVFTPTLTGMGERAHLGRSDPVGLSTHVQDVVATVEFEDLRDVVLCGASYGGVPVTGAAERVPDRLRLVVYIDALVPQSGQSVLDLTPPDFGEAIRAGVAEHGPMWRVPIPHALADALVPRGSLPDAVRAAYLGRLRDQPAATFTEPLKLSGAIDGIPRAFVRCTAGRVAEEMGGDPIEMGAARARENGWPYRELAAPHDPQLFDPHGIAALLEDLCNEM